MNFSIENVIKSLNINATNFNTKNKLIFGTSSGTIFGKILFRNTLEFDFKSFPAIKVLFENIPEDKFVFTENAKSFIVLYDVEIKNNNTNINLPFLVLFLSHIQYLSFVDYQNI